MKKEELEVGFERRVEQLSNDKARRQMNKGVDRDAHNVYGDELDLLGQNERVCVGHQQKI